MGSESNQTTGVIVSAKLYDDTDSWDWPLSRIIGEVNDDQGFGIFKFTHRSFEGWFEARPLVGKRVRFLRYKGQQGQTAEEVELE
ncbi:hypothetical protein [Pseudomonas putida]|uniref:hypothetical protein n=1 Tax=Pseudomonas putida TaxID=303 RepID=UPI003D957EF3